MEHALLSEFHVISNSAGQTISLLLDDKSLLFNNLIILFFFKESSMHET